MVVGHNIKGDVIKQTTGGIFTNISATNAEYGGTTVTAQVYADGHGWVQVKMDGKIVHEYDFDPTFDPAGEAVA
jgi:hypothetical protein